MPEIPPGIKFIIAISPHILVLPALTICGIKLCDLLFDLYMPDWLCFSLSFASFPFALVCSLVYRDVRDSRQAALNGAFLAPSVPTKWPGDLDLLISSLRNLSGGYIGMYPME